MATVRNFTFISFQKKFCVIHVQILNIKLNLLPKNYTSKLKNIIVRK